MRALARITPATVDVLRVLLDEPSLWGMLVIKRTERPAGSVYPILERLESAGWATSSWEAESDRTGPRRRLYELTSEGAEAARSAVLKFEAAKQPTVRAARVAGAGA
jgi:PadR family transcriptional regulator PadR